jgi:hypothetical protein
MNAYFQYIQDKQEVTLNGWFRVQIGPSSEFSDIQAGMSGFGKTCRSTPILWTSQKPQLLPFLNR